MIHTKISNSKYDPVEDIDKIIHFLTNEIFNLEYAFLIITDTGLNKSIMDANKPFRVFLKKSKLHDYSSQKQGIEHKKFIKTFILNYKDNIESKTSLYRPNTKKGDPRLWVYKLKKYCESGNTLLFLTDTKKIYVINLSNKENRNSLLNKNKLYTNLISLNSRLDSNVDISNELLLKIKDIHDKGFIPSIKKGSTGVGMTLEYYLNISPNSDPIPDYKGIELKAKREYSKKSTKNEILSRVPDWKNSRGMNSEKLINEYGYISTDKNNIRRLNLNCTIEANRPNVQGLFLEVDFENDILLVKYKSKENIEKYVLQWDLEDLREKIIKKHPETFWVTAESKKDKGIEYFKYKSIEHTKNPNIAALPYLIDAQHIIVDLVMHKYPNKSVRDHGYLFKIKPKSKNLLFGNPINVYNLDN